MVGTMAGMVLYCAVAATGGEQLIIAGCTGIGCADMAMGCGGCAWWWGAMAIGCGGNGWWWGVMAIGCIVWWCGVMAICCGGIAWWCGIITGCGGIACWCGVMDMGCAGIAWCWGEMHIGFGEMVIGCGAIGCGNMHGSIAIGADKPCGWNC